MALAGHVLYPAYGAGPRLVGMDAITDQQIAGASIALVSKIALFAAFWVVFMNLLSAGSDGREDDGGGGGGGGGGSSPRLDAPAPFRAAAVARGHRRRPDDRRARDAQPDQGAGRVRVSPGLMAAPLR